ncbi:MAG TPA: DUF3147 family protein [Gammaproteobacteria bacterium]|nr:DUF3147 family protein [Gammaproteobacteria bacterium]
MWYFTIKVLVTALVVAGISELSRRYELFAAALASLPLVSILAFVWIYLETSDTQKLGALSRNIFWLVLPSLVFFLVFPALLKQGMGFWLALPLSCLVMLGAYALMLWLLKIV